MENIFDTHAHYDDEAFDIDRADLLKNLTKAGVTGVITCGTDLLSSAKSLKLAEEYDYIYAALGVHPEEAGEERKGDLDLLGDLLSSGKKCVAVGEIGLDYHYEDGVPRETQIDLLTRQIKLAIDLDLPVIIHDRDAHEDIYEILKKYNPRGVVHCFSGSVEMAREIIKLGMYIGLGGVVTFKNARKSLEVLEDVPLSRLLVETDAPYMTPVPHRGERNDSSFIEHVAIKMGEVRNMDPQEILNITKCNAHELFRI